MVRSAMREMWVTWARRAPRLQEELAKLPDFELDVHWELSTWVPLIGRFLPSDVLTFRKRGRLLRSDYHIKAFRGLGGWEKGHFSQMLLPDGDVTALDHVEKAADRGLRARLLEPSETQLALQLQNLVLRRAKQSTLMTAGVSVQPARHAAPRTLGPWEVVDHELSGLRFRMVMREPADQAGNLMLHAGGEQAEEAALAEALSTPSKDDSASKDGSPLKDGAATNGRADAKTEAREQVLRSRARFAPLVAFARKVLDIHTGAETDRTGPGGLMSFEDHFGTAAAAAAADAEAGSAHRPPPSHPQRELGRVPSESVTKAFSRVKLSMCAAGFPLTREQLLPLFELMAVTEEQFESVKAFLESQLGAETGFPVRFTLPVLPAVSATVTFARCELKTPDASLYEVPADYTPGAFKYLPERMAESVSKGKRNKAAGSPRT